jgi:hypothetical protein
MSVKEVFVRIKEFAVKQVANQILSLAGSTLTKAWS